ncbi:hypothetical protein [Pantoea ananatis]|nr:hypothetical protein [Pantoea ananatis]BBL32133.1 hypothetical protein PAFU01_35810 [Pantoea ananatis]
MSEDKDGKVILTEILSEFQRDDYDFGKKAYLSNSWLGGFIKA